MKIFKETMFFFQCFFFFVYLNRNRLLDARLHNPHVVPYIVITNKMYDYSAAVYASLSQCDPNL